jgi:hypothetical protein
MSRVDEREGVFDWPRCARSLLTVRAAKSPTNRDPTRYLPLMAETTQLALRLENDDAALIAALRRELADRQWDFHTVNGLAARTGVSPKAVQRLIDENPKLVRWIPARQDGRWLYVDGSRRRSGRAMLITLRSYMASTITDYYSDAAEQSA